MEALIEVLILGFLISSLYALVAVGFTMIFGVAGVLNLAHGAFAMVGAYLAIWGLSLKLSIPQAFLIAILGVTILAPFIYQLLIRPIEHRPIIVVLATLLLMVLLEQAIILLFGIKPRNLPALFSGYLQLAGTRIPYDRLAASALALLVIGLLWVFVARTRTGKAILALSMERKGAALVGIPAQKITLLVWAISGAMAALAGIFISLPSLFGITPLEDRLLVVIAFSTVVLGGLGSIPGSLWAALIIGYSETIITTAFQLPQARGFAPLVILLLILTLRPQGLFGRAFT